MNALGEFDIIVCFSSSGEADHTGRFGGAGLFKYDAGGASLNITVGDRLVRVWSEWLFFIFSLCYISSASLSP